MTTSKLGLVLVGGWLAQALARTDPDVDAAVIAYEAEDWDLAFEHLDAATARRGERPEIHYDRGLALLAKADKEAAREAFQHGTESDVPAVLASSHYQLGNLAMLDEDWETAIAKYIACLRAQPDHQNAKWNLEIALQRKREQEKKEQEEKEKQDEEKQDEEKGDEEKQDGEKQDGEKQDEEKSDEEKSDEEKSDEQKSDEEKSDEQKQDEQKQDEQKQEQQPPKPIDSGDLDAALEQLDRQDEFLLGRPRGSRRPVEKDW